MTNIFKLLLIVTVTVVCLNAQPSVPATVTPDPSADYQFSFGTGSGFKPYQTPIKSGAYGFIEGSMKVVDKVGIYSFLRVDLLSSYAVMLAEACKSIYSKPSTILMFCGGAGFGADANSIGSAFDGGGKWFFAPKALRDKDAWVGVEIGVAKSSVPAPVQNGVAISPVQPDFRIGLHKFFK